MKITDKKNGFTLIELLAVIVVLAIVTVLAVRNILPFMTDSKKKAFEIDAINVVKSAEDAYNLYQLGEINLNGSTSSKFDNTICFTIEELINLGIYQGDKKIYTGKVLIDIKDTNNLKYKLYFQKGTEFNIIGGLGTDYTNSNSVKFGGWNSNETKIQEYNSCSTITNLPFGYQEVEYLESTGTQYIDTEFKPNNNTSVEVKFQYTKIAASFLFGARDAAAGSSANAFTLNISGENKAVTAYGSSGNKEYAVADKIIHVIKKEKNELYVDGIKQNLTIQNSEFKSKGSLEIFAAYDAGTFGKLKSNAKIYYFKLYDNGILVRHMVPCYKLSNNERGLYDLIENKFYTNQGTGTFGIGSNI